MVPLRPYITRLCARVSVDQLRGTIRLTCGSSDITMQVGSLQAHSQRGPLALRAAPFEQDDAIYVPLAAIARERGELVSYEAQAHTVLVADAIAPPLATMTPYNASEPRVAPTQIFTAEPKRTDRPVLSGTPHPRRTPIPATPSWP